MQQDLEPLLQSAWLSEGWAVVYSIYELKVLGPSCPVLPKPRMTTGGRHKCRDGAVGSSLHR